MATGEYGDPLDLYKVPKDLNIDSSILQCDRACTGETEVAGLMALRGLSVLRWFSYEKDSFGPLIRGVRYINGTNTLYASYG